MNFGDGFCLDAAEVTPEEEMRRLEFACGSNVISVITGYPFIRIKI